MQKKRRLSLSEASIQPRRSPPKFVTMGLTPRASCSQPVLGKVCAPGNASALDEIGILSVTQRPFVGASYIVTPGETTSLEVA